MLVRRVSTRTASLAEEIRVATVGDQNGVMLFGMGRGGTAGMAGATKVSARREERAIFGGCFFFLLGRGGGFGEWVFGGKGEGLAM